MKHKAQKTLSLLLSVLLAFSFSLLAMAADGTDGAITYIDRVWDYQKNVVTATEKTTKVIAVFEKHEHQYRSPDWTWADNHSSATATFTCDDCGDEQTVEATITEEEISPADCTNDQVAIYTATVDFDGETFTDQTDEIAVPNTAGHVYGIRITPATCTTDGITTYKCVRCGNTYTKDPVPAAGHKDDDRNGVCDTCGEPMPDETDVPQKSGKCKWCGKTHSGFWGSIVKFFHAVFWFFAHLFGRR